MNASAGERVLAGELLVSFTMEWIGAVVKMKAAPSPRQMLGIPLTFSLLALAAAVGGPNIAKVAAGLGGLVTLTILLKALGTVPQGAAALSSSGQPTNPILAGIGQVASVATGPVVEGMLA